MFTTTLATLAILGAITGPMAFIGTDVASARASQRGLAAFQINFAFPASM